MQYKSVLRGSTVMLCLCFVVVRETVNFDKHATRSTHTHTVFAYKRCGLQKQIIKLLAPIKKAREKTHSHTKFCMGSACIVVVVVVATAACGMQALSFLSLATFSHNAASNSSIIVVAVAAAAAANNEYICNVNGMQRQQDQQQQQQQQ